MGDHVWRNILALALAVDADIIVSDDAGLTVLSPWLGRPIVRPREFVRRYLQRRGR